MTKKVEKTNVQYLRELIEKGHDERMEFLEAVEKELAGKIEKIEELEGELDTSDSGDDDEEPEYANTIETDMEPLQWQCGNIAIQSLMETFEEKLHKLGHIQLEAALTAL